MLQFSEIFVNFLAKIPELIFERILIELQSEKFEWFGPSPIEPFNLLSADGGPRRRGVRRPHRLERRDVRAHVAQLAAELARLRLHFRSPLPASFRGSCSAVTMRIC